MFLHPLVASCLSLFLLWHLPDCSANSNTAWSSAAVMFFLFPLISGSRPPNIAVRLLNRSLIFSRSCRLGSRSSGQSMNTWTIVSAAPHSHLSFELLNRFRKLLNQLCPVLSCARRLAWCLGRRSYSFRACGPGAAGSILRRC